MKASYQKETLETTATTIGTHSPVLRAEGGNRFVKKGESRECFYFGVARKLIGDKWSLLVLFILRDGCMRFNALLRGVEGISQKVLASTLRDLERDGYIKREVLNTSPPSTEYSLTRMGASFLEVLGTVSGWVESNWQAMEECRREYDFKTDAIG
jgi:DNA-binding HxlR family transcriptional regulator